MGLWSVGKIEAKLRKIEAMSSEEIALAKTKSTPTPTPAATTSAALPPLPVVEGQGTAYDTSATQRFATLAKTYRATPAAKDELANARSVLASYSAMDSAAKVTHYRANSKSIDFAVALVNKANASAKPVIKPSGSAIIDEYNRVKAADAVDGQNFYKLHSVEMDSEFRRLNREAQQD